MSPRKPRTTLGDVLAMKGQALPTKGVGMEILAPPPAAAEVLIEVALSRIAGTNPPAELAVTEDPALQSTAEIGNKNDEEKPTATSGGRGTSPRGLEGTAMSTIEEMFKGMSADERATLLAKLQNASADVAADGTPPWIGEAMRHQGEFNKKMLATVTALQENQGKGKKKKKEKKNAKPNPLLALLGAQNEEELEAMGSQMNPLLRGAGLAHAVPSSIGEHLEYRAARFGGKALDGAAFAFGVGATSVLIYLAADALGAVPGK